MEIDIALSKRALEDYELVKQAQTGDEKAFTILLKRYQNKIYNLLLKKVNNPADAEDLTIESFGKAFKNIDKYSPQYAFSTWLFRIVRNNYIDFVRRNYEKVSAIKISHEDLNQTLDESISNFKYYQLESNDDDPEEILIRKQKKAIISTIINEMKPTYRRLIEMRYFKEMSYEEIALELNIPEGTLKSQLYRARELIYNILCKTKQNL